MCRMASFLYKYTEDTGLEVAVYDLMSHSNTQEHLKLTEKMKWYEGHYTPKEIVCRTPEGQNKIAEQKVKERWKDFSTFVKWCINDNIINGDLNLYGCNLKGIKLPETVNGWLNLRGCNLKGI